MQFPVCSRKGDRGSFRRSCEKAGEDQETPALKASCDVQETVHVEPVQTTPVNVEEVKPALQFDDADDEKAEAETIDPGTPETSPTADSPASSSSEIGATPPQQPSKVEPGGLLAQSPLTEGGVGPAAAGEEAAIGLGIVLDGMVRLAPKAAARTVFHGIRACPVPIKDYVARLRTYFACSIECYVMALLYIDRAIKRHPRLVTDSQSVHRLALCGLMLAAKFQDDIFYANAFYAKVGGLTVKELNSLEVTMLRMLDYRLMVDPEEFKLYHTMISQAMGPRMAL